MGVKEVCRGGGPAAVRNRGMQTDKVGLLNGTPHASSHLQLLSSAITKGTPDGTSILPAPVPLPKPLIHPHIHGVRDRYSFCYLGCGMEYTNRPLVRGGQPPGATSQMEALLTAR